MLFSSISFLYFFLPLVLTIYYFFPWKLKNGFLLTASLFFYFYGEPVYCILLILSSLSGYLHGLWIAKTKRSGLAKLPLLSSIIVSVGILVFFKYADFFIVNANHALGTGVMPLNLALPLGISFYTFQILTYTIDLYRNKAKVQTNLINFTTYVSLFPQLIAGPIVRYTAIESELSERSHSFKDTAEGINRFIVGLAKKVLLANTLGELGHTFTQTNEKTILFFWLAAFAFTLQIYFDFSGYSDMAIGLGRIFGFHFPENFNYPYVAQSITEFWRRWHMTLGTWFRDYVYIPLGGNRVSPGKWLRNITVVWFLTGFWHGAEWNFILWGLYFALLLMLEKYFLKKLLDQFPSPVRHFYLLFFITISFAIFNANGFTESMTNLKGMFGLLDVPLSNTETIYYFKSYLIVLLLAALGATPITKAVINKLQSTAGSRRIFNLLLPVVHVSLLLLITGYLIDDSFNPFLYFRF